MPELSYRNADVLVDFEFGRRLHHFAYQDVVTRQFGSWDEPIQDKFFKEGWDRAPHKIILFDDTPIGVFSVDEHPDHIFFSELQILPEYQKLGIGTQIFKEQMDFARSKKLPLRLQVLRENKARELYLRLGFSVTNTTNTHVMMEWKG